MSDLKTAALEYHAQPRPGKLSVEFTKPTATARDLALASLANRRFTAPLT